MTSARPGREGGHPAPRRGRAPHATDDGAERRGRAAGPRPARHRGPALHRHAVWTPVRQIIAELGDLIYQDPDTQVWHTADVYLSGNVRAKLAAAERADGRLCPQCRGPARWSSPRMCCPATSTPTWARPGSRSISRPSRRIFSAPLEDITVVHLTHEALWSLDAGITTTRSVAATTEYGTARANGVGLLEQALNLKSPTIYDVFERDGKEERVLNQEETLAARDKQKAIKERFRAWIFADPDRTERLVRFYNETYNNLRLRRFDGSHLAFPGMSPHIALTSTRRRLAHHEQWHAPRPCRGCRQDLRDGRCRHENAPGGADHQAALCRAQSHAGTVWPGVLQLYPNAKLLLAAKEDFTRERRKLLTAKMASGVGRHHHDPQLLRAYRHVAGVSGALRGSRSPPTTSSCVTALPPRRPARTATSSRRSRSRKPGARSA